MSVTVSGGGNSQDFDLNLAPIIDCLTVLVTFMLASAAFLSIGILDAGIAAAGAEASKAEPAPINIVAELKKDHSIVIKLSGKENRSITVQASNGGWDLDGFKANLASIKNKWPNNSALTLQAENDVEYRALVETMEAARKSMPAVLLGGF